MCFNVNLFTTEFGNEISWSIGCHDKSCTECVSTPESGVKYDDNSEYTQQCCLPVNQQSFLIKCKDSWGDGWSDGYLEINGKRYCEQFSSGKKKEESMANEKAPEGPG